MSDSISVIMMHLEPYGRMKVINGIAFAFTRSTMNILINLTFPYAGKYYHNMNYHFAPGLKTTQTYIPERYLIS